MLQRDGRVGQRLRQSHSVPCVSAAQSRDRNPARRRLGVAKKQAVGLNSKFQLRSSAGAYLCRRFEMMSCALPSINVVSLLVAAN